VRGAVRVRHILFLYVVIFAAAGITGMKLGAGAEPEWRFAWQAVIWGTVEALLVVTLTIVVPELRRSVRILYAPSRSPLTAGDSILFVALMITSVLGVNRILFAFPLLHWRPDLAGFMGYFPHIASPSATLMLLSGVTMGILAPFAEELFFRGYLQNLWHRRWGLWPAVALSALFFGLGHVQGAVYATLGGVFFSLIYVRTGSLWPGTLLHGLYNIVGLLIGSFFGRVFFEKGPEDFASLAHWIPELVLTAAFFPLLFLFWRRFRPNT
jgi:membrane protease YdiL (CAAX protease family)